MGYGSIKGYFELTIPGWLLQLGKNNPNFDCTSIGNAYGEGQTRNTHSLIGRVGLGKKFVVFYPITHQFISLIPKAAIG